jgi:MFS family permease
VSERRGARRAERSTPSYGWVVVAASAVIMGTAVGITFYGTTVYLRALTAGPDAFGLGVVSAATGAFMLVGGVAGLGVGWLLRVVDARAVVASGAVVMSVGLLLVGRAAGDAELVASYALMGVGFAATTVIPASSLISSWFVRRRVAAMSIAFTGLPLGGAVFTPVVAGLVEAEGVPGAGAILAVVLVAVIVPLACLLRPGPSAPVKTIERGEPGALAVTVPPGHAYTLGQAVRSPWFVVVTTGMTLGMLCQLGTQAHLYNAISERADQGAAAALVSLVAATSLAGRAVGSWALGRVSLRLAGALFLGLQGCCVLGIGLVPDGLVLALAAAGFGVTMGNLQIIQPLLLVEQFGTREFGRIFALENMVATIGMAVGPVIVGQLFAIGDSYELALTLVALPTLLGSLLLVMSRRWEPARRPVPAVRDTGARSDVDATNAPAACRNLT